jgi:hemerythrin superfamily protein
VDAISLLKQDHGNVETLFKRFEALPDDDPAEKRRIVDKVIEQLSVHAEVEEQIFYPAARQRLAESGIVLEALEEHHLAKFALNELEKLPPSSERFDAKFHVLMELIREHVEEEEKDLFPQMRKALKQPELQELGEAMERAKATAPTRPHPLAPDQPPLNVLLGLPVAVMDRAVGVVKQVIRTATGSR